MKKIITAAIFVAACSSSAYAQVSNFTGPSVGVNLDHTAINYETSASSGYFENGYGQQSIGASIQGAYGFALSNNIVLSVGANYSLVDSKSFDASSGSGYSITSKLKNQSSLYLEPGYLVSEKTLAYGKVSYESAKASQDATGQANISKNLHGMGYGFGIRTMLDKNLSLQAELKSVKYGSESSSSTSQFKTSATVGTIGLGYKF